MQISGWHTQGFHNEIHVNSASYGMDFFPCTHLKSTMHEIISEMSLIDAVSMQTPCINCVK